MFRILIIGAGGFAKELLETVVQNDPSPALTFYDDVGDDLPDRLFDRFPVITNEAEARAYFRDVHRAFALGVGSPQSRAGLYEKFVALGGDPKTIVSPFAKIGRYGNSVGEGSCILTNAVVETNNRIGKGTLIHIGALVSHDVGIGEFCEISPRASLLGNVKIGDKCSLGTGCIILPKISVGNDVVVGAGAVVTKDVPDGTTVVGVPARPIES
jgi:sugar O-acyltransferase (sialic acid O-acetyltransferase NeuD family)